MKTKQSLLLLFFAALLFNLTSCASKEEGEKTAKEFYEALKAKDYDKAMSMVDASMIENEGEEAVLNMLTQKEALGDLKSYTQEDDYKLMERNGKSMVRLLYTTEYESAKLYEYIVLSKTDDGYKVISYAYYNEEAKRKEYMDDLEGND